MDHLHIGRDTYWSYFRGLARKDWAALRRFVGSILTHLHSECSRCRSEAEAFHQEFFAAGGPNCFFDEFMGLDPSSLATAGWNPGNSLNDEADGETSYQETWEKVESALAQRSAVMAGEEERASATLEALLNLPDAGRSEAVQSEPNKYRSLALVDRLLGKSKDSLPGNAEGSLAHARLAKLVLSLVTTSAYADELGLRAQALAANAQRSLGDLPAADEAFLDLRRHQRRLGVADPMLAAEIDSFEGSLRYDQRRFHETEALLRRSIADYLEAEALVEAGRVLLKLSLTHREQSLFSEELAVAEDALALFEDLQEPRYALYAKHSIALALCDLERFFEAQKIYLEFSPAYDRFPDPTTQLRRLWLEARIARGLDRPDEAESLLTAVAEGFLKRDNPFDFALASLERAGLYLDLGRIAEVRQLVQEVVPLFAAQNVPAEAAKALTLLEEAARRERLTAAYLLRVVTFLGHARRDPRLRFEA